MSKTPSARNPKPAPTTPTLEQERRLWRAGVVHIAGLDEAGRGALAGPVVAGAVILPVLDESAGLPAPWDQVRDSKALSPARRAALFEQVQAAALAWGIGQASPQEIDRIGIAPANRLAMQRAIEALDPPPAYLLIDWARLDQVNLPQERFVKGDARIVSIAAASILAKVHRDRTMVALAQRYPVYGFERHKGYGAAVHLAAIERHGPCPAHRHSFAPIARRPSLFDQIESPDHG